MVFMIEHYYYHLYNLKEQTTRATHTEIRQGVGSALSDLGGVLVQCGCANPVPEILCVMLSLSRD